MRIVMLLTGRNPFGRDWARAAEQVVDVVTLDLVTRTTLPARAAHVAADGRDYEVAKVAYRPTRALLPVSNHLTARRLRTALIAIEADHGPVDLLHTHYYHGTPAVRLLRDRRYVHTEHSAALVAAAVPGRATHDVSPAGMRMARRGLRDAERVMAVSTFLRDHMERLGLGGPIEVVPNPVDVDVFTPAPPDEVDRDLVVTVCRLSREKRVHLLLEALAVARRARPALRLEVAGDGSQLPALRRRVQELALDDAVTFHGRLPRPEVAALVRRAGVFVNTSEVETFGVAVAEALAAGVPVVAPAASGTDLVGPEDGLLVDVTDPRALGDAIGALAERDGDRAARSARLAALAAPSVVASHLERIYAQALA